MSKKKDNQSVKGKNFLGIDYGGRNIGVALGKDGYVTPLKIIDGKNQNSAIAEIIRIALENKVEAFVMGLPLTAEGKETTQSLKNRHFAKLLKIKSRKKVLFCNEEGSTQEALDSLIATGASSRKRRYSDNVAAGIILKRFFQESL
ncbi:MAG: putative pre-16S rRNA nuclease [Patescibacteria group bacterium]|nr:MAG: putative pre-16S rRNA nuclease [Patescibacteria group bacterium]